ncbi:MAG: hypothetical protein IJ647_09055 [Prevotella sp.]|nr:hypothetical protein [Prevotella sp.]
MVTYDNITRYSEFMFGNSAPMEHMMLFPEILEDEDENKEGDESDVRICEWHLAISK